MGHRFRHRPVMHRRPLVVGLAAAIACASVRADVPTAPRPSGDADLSVTNCGDSGPGSLRDVVASALNGDHIAFLPTIGCNRVALTSGPVMIGNDADGMPFTQLDITGLGPDALTIDGGELDRVFVQDAGDSAILTLNDLAVTHGFTDGDGGCILAHGTLVLSNVEVSTCRAGVISGDTALGGGPVRGGGIYARDLTLDASIVTYSDIYNGPGYSYGGGAFALTSMTLTSSTIVGNSVRTAGASYGGGVAVGDRAGRAQGTITMTSSIVTDNTAGSSCSYCGVRGAGIWSYGNATLTGGEVSANTATSTFGYGTGGGFYFNARYGGTDISATISGTHFHCNVADAAGAIAAGGDLAVSGATFDCNSTISGDGGAIELLGGNLTMTYSTLTANSAAARGGGIFVFGYGDAAISNSTISGNGAFDGGAIANTYGSLHIANSTIANNAAVEHGGGIYLRYAYYTTDLRSTIVAANQTNGAPEDLWPPGMTVSGSNDLVVAAPGVDLPGDTLSADPLLLPLADNGGPTPTQALADGSPAIDAGSNDAALAFDQRGDGFVRTYGAGTDIGAFEVQPTGPTDRIFANGFDP